MNAIKTVGELAASDIRKAEVFKKFGLEFCCGGKKSLQQACKELDIDIAEVEKELQKAIQEKSLSRGFDFNSWEPGFLADYIYNEHHKYYYEEIPIIAGLMEKVTTRHGATQPQLQKLSGLFNSLQNELNIHFMKEERVLFPLIHRLVKVEQGGAAVEKNNLPSITEPLLVMERDHEAAGSVLEEMRKVTDNYTAPANACNSFRLLYHKLKNLDEDLHQHIHLENNILFPKAILLEEALSKRTCHEQACTYQKK